MRKVTQRDVRYKSNCNVYDGNWYKVYFHDLILLIFDSWQVEWSGRNQKGAGRV